MVKRLTPVIDFRFCFYVTKATTTTTFNIRNHTQPNRITAAAVGHLDCGLQSIISNSNTMVVVLCKSEKATVRVISGDLECSFGTQNVYGGNIHFSEILMLIRCVH